jgi:hypothetical protein
MATLVLPTRAVHLDFAARPRVTDVGLDFHAEEFAETPVRAGVEYVTVLARRRLGCCCYPIPARNVDVKLSRDGRTARRVSLAPSGEELSFRADGGAVRFAIPEVCGYQLAVVE